MEELTSAQILFMGLAGMEDAQVKSGNGLVKRSAVDAQQQAISTEEYFRAKRRRTPGTEEYEAVERLRVKQTGLRKILDGKVRKLVQEDMRYR